MRIPLSHRIAIAESVTGTAPVVLRGVVEEDLAPLRSALKKNAEHLAPWTPAVRGPMPWTLVEAARTVARHRAEWEEDRGYALFAFAGTTIVGKVALSHVVRGAMEGAYLGYWVAGDAQGRGLATALVAAAVRFAFATAGLHRVQAAVMPRNLGSLRVLAKNGFREEGLALRYLQIAGRWEDHTIFARTVEDDGDSHLSPDRRTR
jgi:ribosomal-protein-alanine N-acetyltransferase